MKILTGFILGLFALAFAAFIAIYSGTINVAADNPHSKAVLWLLDLAREQSIAARTAEITPPDLDDPKLLAVGAEHYPAMCSGCHLAPGESDNELRMGLYPEPPNLAQHSHEDGQALGDEQADAARHFWIVKHGIKATGMPAWGETHDDESIWGLVAFLKQLPHMSESRYAELTAGAESHESGGHGHSEGHAHGSGHGH